MLNCMIADQMKLLVCLSAFCLAAAAAAKFEFLEEWQMWKEQHGKQYQSGQEELERHLVWLSNKQYIDQHNVNSDIFGFTLAMNHFGDLTDTEFMEQYGTYTKRSNYTNQKIFKPPLASYPDSIDWRTKGAVTSIKNQGQCGASYAFSAIGALEGAWSLAHGKTVTLSEQNIIDCSLSYGNHGCQGGNMYNSYLYMIANEGIETAKKYPFQGKQSSCTFDKQDRGAEMSGSVSIKSSSESDLQAALAYVGPVAVAVDASSRAFRYYYAGVYDLPGCSSSSLTHALVVTGYGTYGSKNYWLVKNSWGSYWGMNGYIMMVRNKYNQCGIATDASYPTL